MCKYFSGWEEEGNAPEECFIGLPRCFSIQRLQRNYQRHITGEEKVPVVVAGRGFPTLRPT